MSFEFFFMYLYIIGAYCTFPENSAKDNEILYMFQENECRWDLLSQNNISTPLDGNYDTFLWEHTKVMKIIVYYNRSSDNNYSLQMHKLDFNLVDISQHDFDCDEEKCFFEIMPNIGFNSNWNIVLTNHTTNETMSKNFKFHKRLLTGEMLVTSPNEALITTRTANENIKDFDTFHCLVFNDFQPLTLHCGVSESISINPTSEQETTEIKKIYWTNKTFTGFYEYDGVAKPEYDGTHFDCHRKLKPIDDFETERVYLIRNESGSTGKDLNKVVRKPVASDDYVGCLRYVNCLYDDCSTPEASATQNWNHTYTIGIVALVGMLIVPMVFFTVKYLKWKRNKNSRDSLISYTATSVPNEYVDIHRMHQQDYEVEHNDDNVSPGVVNNGAATETNNQEHSVENELYGTVDHSSPQYTTIVGVIKNGESINF